jgi:pyruvate,water dikinase
MRQNVGQTSKDPIHIQREQVAKRREVMDLQEQRARKSRCLRPFEFSKVQKRNAYLEHLMWIRNSPKLHLSKICGILRKAVLKVEDELIQANRLERKGDIFHVNLKEVDLSLKDGSFDLMALIRNRKTVYERALRAKECPLMVDSRCRILKPDPPAEGEYEEGTLVGSAISPGIARGRVRIVRNPADRFERGEVLAAFVTSPAWTPLFVGASAIILQVGGVLQHGALCAREFQKPAVSNIDIYTVLKTGMMVEVDGNTGIVKILDE